MATQEATVLQRILEGSLRRRAEAEVAKERHQERKAEVERITGLEEGRGKELPRLQKQTAEARQ